MKENPSHIYQSISTDFGPYTTQWPTYISSLALIDLRTQTQVELSENQKDNLFKLLLTRGRFDTAFDRQARSPEALRDLEDKLNYIF